MKWQGNKERNTGMTTLTSLMQTLERGGVSRTRRNHALEHATLRVLAERNPQIALAGYSDPRGIWILGQVDTEELAAAVQEARSRLNSGEHDLAIHPHCGTNYATSGILAGLAAWLVMLGTGSGLRRKLDRLPTVISVVTLALIFSGPLGPKVQKNITTKAELGSLHVTEIIISERNGMPVHRIRTSD